MFSNEVVSEEDVSRTIASMPQSLCVAPEGIQALRIETEALTYAAEVWEATILDS